MSNPPITDANIVQGASPAPTIDPSGPTEVKKSNKILIIILVSFVLLLLCCCCSWFFGMLASESILEQLGPELQKEIKDEIKRELEKGSDSDAYYDLFGQTVEEWNINVLRTEDPYVDTDSDQFLMEGERLVAVELQVKNTATSSQSFPQYFLSIVDNTGEKYYTTSHPIQNPELPKDIIDPGNSVTGWVTFVLSQDSTGLVLEHENPNTQESIRIDL